MQMAKDKKIILVPNSLEACMEIEGEQYKGNGEPLAIASGNAGKLVNDDVDIANNSEVTHPHFVDTILLIASFSIFRD